MGLVLCKLERGRSSRQMLIGSELGHRLVATTRASKATLALDWRRSLIVFPCLHSSKEVYHVQDYFSSAVSSFSSPAMAQENDQNLLGSWNWSHEVEGLTATLSFTPE